jgi:hypothetical protein
MFIVITLSGHSNNEKLFRGVVPAHGVLKGEVELVLGFGLEKRR